MSDIVEQSNSEKAAIKPPEIPKNNPEHNPIVDTAESVINGLIMKAGVNLAVNALQANFPFLKFALFDWIIRYLVSKVGEKIIRLLSPFVVFNIIKFDNEGDRQTYDLAVESLKKAISTGDQNAIDEANKKFDEDFDKLIKFGGH